jgi:hypothetical protein
MVGLSPGHVANPRPSLVASPAVIAAVSRSPQKQQSRASHCQRRPAFVLVRNFMSFVSSARQRPDCLHKPPVAHIFAPVSPRTQASRGKTHTKIFPGDDKFAHTFPPYLVSSGPQPRSREYGGTALCLTSMTIRSNDKYEN